MASSRRTVFAQLQRLIWERIPARTDGPPSGGFCVPSSGVAGDIVRIFVTQAHSITSITFGGVAATNLQPVGDNEIQCVAGTHIKGLVDVVCTSALGSATLKSAFEYTIGVAPPTLSSANYTQGDTLGGGQPIVLTGTWDVGSAVPQIDGVDLGAGTYTVDSATQITFTLPAHAAGAASITVRDAGGTSGALSFEFWDPSQLSATSGVWEDYGGSPWTARAGSVGGDLDTASLSQGLSVGSGAGGFASIACAGGALNGTARSTGAGHNIEDFISMSGATPAPGPGTTAWVVFKPNTAGSDGGSGTPYNNRGLLSTNAGGYFLVSHSTAGFVCNVYDGSYDAVTAACSLGSGAAGLGAWHMGVFVYDGTNAQASVDGSALASASVPQGMPSTAGDNVYFLQACNNFGVGAQLDGEILAFGVTRDVATDADVTKLRAWAQQRYGVSV